MKIRAWPCFAMALAVAACGAEAESVTDEAAIVGSYAITNNLGESVVSQINPDGTFSDEMNGQVIRNGDWRLDEQDRVCFDAGGFEGEQCYVFSPKAGDGTVEVTDVNGNTFTMTHNP